VACEHKLETAAQAVAVNNGDDGHAQPIEAIDYRMRLVQTIYDEGDIGHAAEFADVRAGNESARLRRAQHHALGLLAFDTREHVAQFGEHLLVERVRARSCLVENEPGDAGIIARKLPISPPVTLGPSTVMRGLVPRIHVLRARSKAWMAGPNPAITIKYASRE